ncbi:MAG: nonstructural protein [Arizlama microvirus]|nr:MAG: nonstructural protein [Arizlama microvirus]
MRIKMFSIRDLQLSIFTSPMFLNSEIQAVRQIYMAMNNHPDNQLTQFPENFQLVELGEFDDTTGRFETYDVPKLIITAEGILRQIDKSRKDKQNVENQN